MNVPIQTAKNYPDQALDHFPHCNICARNAFLSTVVDALGRSPYLTGVCRMEYVEPRNVTSDALTRVWSVAEFCDRHRIDDRERQRLLELFGSFATASELLHNARREPKFR
jgi:hypothetical protein